MTYFRHGHYVEVDNISSRKDIALTNQVLDYKVSRVSPRLVILRLENVDITPKLNPRIHLGIFSDIRIDIPRFIH